MKRLMLSATASLLLLAPAFAQDTPSLDFTMVPSGGWPVCDVVKSVPCPLPGQEPWLISVFTSAGADVVGYQAILSFLPKDGVDGDPLQTATFAFARNDQTYGTDANGNPLIYTAHTEPLGRIQPKTLTVNGLVVTFGKTITFPPPDPGQSASRAGVPRKPAAPAPVHGDKRPLK
jgi:hypothetical protein